MKYLDELTARILVLLIASFLLVLCVFVLPFYLVK